MLGGPLAATIPVSLVAGLMAVAIVVVILGHLSGVRGVLASGLLLLFLATFAMVAGGFGAWRDSPNPTADPMRGDPSQLPAPGETIGQARQAERDAVRQQQNAKR